MPHDHHPFHPFPADASRAPMNACRQTLSAAVAALADEVEILDQALRPVQRLGELTNDLERLDREIAALKVPYETQLGEWIAAGSQGERPRPPWLFCLPAEHQGGRHISAWRWRVPGQSVDDSHCPSQRGRAGRPPLGRCCR
jgi:hypothetical protein